MSEIWDGMCSRPLAGEEASPNDGGVADVLPIRFAALARARWANGGGETRELYRSPSFGDYDVRLSIATIAGPGGFSCLPGVDRALMALGPDGLVLDIAGSRVELARLQTATFAGEDEVTAVEVASASHDLNLMVRRGHGLPALDAVIVEGRLETPADAIAAVALTPGLVARGVPLEFGDAVLGGGVAIRGAGVVAIATCRPPAPASPAEQRTGSRAHGA